MNCVQSQSTFFQAYIERDLRDYSIQKGMFPKDACPHSTVYPSMVFMLWSVAKSLQRTLFSFVSVCVCVTVCMRVSMYDEGSSSCSDMQPSVIFL